MTPESFQNLMQPILDVFGMNEYSPTRLQLIFEVVGDLPDKNFAMIVRHFCKSRSVKNPPLPTHFEEESMGQRKRILDYSMEDASQAIDDRGPEKLQELLGKYGATNVLDLMGKIKSMKLEEAEDGLARG